MHLEENLTFTPLTALSPLDGRYFTASQTLRPIFSEFGLIAYRFKIEVLWLKALASHPKIKEIPNLAQEDIHYLDEVLQNFQLKDAQHIKDIEKSINHDVKAVEYFLKEILKQRTSLHPYIEFTHFACTSEDINNLAYALMVKEGRDTVLIPALKNIAQLLRQFAHQYADIPMLALTHGQPASPTTVGKEFANFTYRLERQIHYISQQAILGKINGAVGNFNAHYITYPEIDWIDFSENFIKDLGLTPNPYTIQIEPHDYLSELFSYFTNANTILIDFARDIWSYIALKIFKQKINTHEVGSSTMPHKVNPIDFENAEGNLGIANSLFEHYRHKLPISRWQRDLSDSTVLRTLGIAFGHSLIAYQSLKKGLNKLEIDQTTTEKLLADNWEVLAEAIQTIMRRYGLPEPYEQLKQLTRGQRLTAESLHTFIQALDLPEAVKAQLLTLTPNHYIGLASELARKI